MSIKKYFLSPYLDSLDLSFNNIEVDCVSDPFRFDTDPRIRLREYRIRIRFKIEKNTIFLILFYQKYISGKNVLLLCVLHKNVMFDYPDFKFGSGRPKLNGSETLVERLQFYCKV